MENHFFGITEYDFKWAIVILFVVFLLRTLVDLFIFVENNKITKLFHENNLFTVSKKMERTRKVCKFFSAANKATCRIYNNLCYIYASVNYLQGKPDLFEYYLNEVKKEKLFELKSFMYALFFLSKNQREAAEKWDREYFECVHQDPKLQIILDYLFRKKGKLQEIQTAVMEFQNPAIKKMLADLNCPGIMQAEDTPTS